jgi:hypothetical protein
VTIAVCLYAFWTCMWTTWVSFEPLISLSLCVGCWVKFVATGLKFVFQVTQKGAMFQEFRQGERSLPLLPHWLRYCLNVRMSACRTCRILLCTSCRESLDKKWSRRESLDKKWLCRHFERVEF